MRSSIWRSTWRKSALVLALVALGGAPVFAQAQTGNVYGTAIDENGARLTGVTVTLSGAGAPQVQTTDVQGQFRFVGVYPGTYRLEATLEHFNQVVHEKVVVNVNRNTTLELTLSGVVADVLTIVGGTEMLDRSKVSTGRTVDFTDLH